MFTNSGHVCEQFNGRRSGSYVKKHSRECPAINSSNNCIFTCGGCHTKFRTICCLHVHIQKHQEGGSYTFDHVTNTAFPKYDSVCAFTQVENDIFEIICSSFSPADKTSKSIQTLDDQSKTKCVKDGFVTKSICIARRNYNKYQASTDIDDNELDKIQEFENQKHNIRINTSVASKEVVCSKQKRKHNTILENVCKRQTKQIKHIQSKNQVAGEFKLLDDIEQKRVLNLAQEKKTLEDVTDLTCSSKDIIESIDPKTDEIAASEALLAISKSADGEKTNLKIVKSEVEKDMKEDLNKQEYGDVNDTRVSNSGLMKNLQQKTCLKFVNTFKTPENDESSPLEAQKDHNSKKEKLRCPTCGKYGSRSMISYHKYLHKEQKELSCDVCGKLFQHPSCLKVHLRCHSGRLFQCEICEEKFSRKTYLDTHMLKHTGEKPYMCENCGKGYRDANHLKRHIKHVHDKQRDFECDLCHERFFRSDHLKCHRMRHFGPGHRCQFCKKMFKVKLDLDRHLKTHTEGKKWFCHLCGHGFRYPVPYYTHMLKKHDIQRDTAKIWRKRQIERNRKAPHLMYAEQTDQGSFYEPVNTNTDRSEAPLEDLMIVNSVQFFAKPSVKKIFLQDDHILPGNANAAEKMSIKLKGSSFELNKMSKEVRTITDMSAVNSEQESNMYLQTSNKGYEIVTMGDRSRVETVHDLSDFTSETTSLEQGLTFSVQNTFPEEENDGVKGYGIVGYEEGDQLQGNELVVMAEETVVDDMNSKSKITGEHDQASLFLGSECSVRGLADKGTML